jgi:hypothetical protein
MTGAEALRNTIDLAGPHRLRISAAAEAAADRR